MKHPHHSPGANASFPQEMQVVFGICQRMGASSLQTGAVRMLCHGRERSMDAMQMVTCPCGAEFKTHTVEEAVEHAILHVKSVHPNDFPQGLSRDEALKMVREV